MDYASYTGVSSSKGYSNLHRRRSGLRFGGRGVVGGDGFIVASGDGDPLLSAAKSSLVIERSSVCTSLAAAVVVGEVASSCNGAVVGLGGV